MLIYKIAKALSFIVRAILCYLTIETTPIFENESINWIVGQLISVYSILWVISYSVVGRYYRTGEVPILGVVLYFVVYAVATIILWLVLVLLHTIGVLPL